MKEHWYLVASLPHLRFGEKPPMDGAGFRASCVGHLSGEEMATIEAILENREPKAGGTPAVQWWNAEVQLRDAVVRLRAKNRGTDGTQFLKPFEGFSATIEKMVADALSRSNPLEQEEDVDRIRWMLADELALTQPFGFSGVLAFAIKVRIAERWAEFDEEAGKEKVEELILSATTEEIETGTKL